MNNIKMYQLNNIKKCPFKGFISTLDFKTENNKNSMIRKVYKTILRDYIFIVNCTEDELKERIINLLDDNYFLTTQEKEIDISVIFNYLVRYKKYEQSLYRKVINSNIKGIVNINNINIEVGADIVINNTHCIELIKYKTSATELSYKARTSKNLPENNIELFLMKKLGEEKYKNYNKPIVASFYHMKGKNEDSTIFKTFLKDKEILYNQIEELSGIIALDKKEQKKINKQITDIQNVLFFNHTNGNNIIEYDYDKDLSEEIKQICNTQLNFESEKCESSDCEFCNFSTLCKYQNQNKQQDDLEIVKEIKKGDSELRLTDNQKKVVDVEEDCYRVNSTAGSGKSTTMVTRTINLFKKGYNPNDILLITFTNKGCQELKDKIKYWLKRNNMNNIKTNDLNIFTFNGFGGHIISNEWESLGFTQPPRIATTIDIIDIIRKILSEYPIFNWLDYKNPLINYPNAKGVIRQLIIYFDMIKSFNYTEEEFINNNIINNVSIEEAKNRTHIIFEMYDKFNKQLKKKNLIQYQDQILYLIQLLQSDNKFIAKYGYKHIIVDEYQDTDFTQVQLLHLLKQYKNFKSLMVVGDNSQAIFSFRNTTPKNILEFDKEFDNVKDISLLENFRSTPQICNVANKLDRLNTQRIDKDIISQRDNGDIPKLICYDTLDNENKTIVELIKNKINDGYNQYDICYIARTKKELLEMKELLHQENIPSIVEASELYLDNLNVQAIINLAKFFKNNELDYYLMEYLYMQNIIDEENINEIKEKIVNKSTKTNNKKENQDEKETIDENIEKLKIDLFYMLLSPTETDIVAKDFIDSLKEKSFHTFNQLLMYLYKIELYKDDTSIEKNENKYNAIVLTTAHSSKGKEWKVVINSINNYKYNKENIDLLEEERRLLFVSITRAKDELYITYNTNENKSRNKGKYCLFADELDGVERIDN